MWPFPAKHFTWQEPPDFVRKLHDAKWQALRWWHRLALVLQVSLLFLLGWRIARLNPNNQPPPLVVALLICVSGAVLYVTLFRLLRFVKSWITCFDDFIQRNQGGHCSRLSYVDVVEFEMGDEGSYHVLVFTSLSGSRVEFAVPKSVSIEQLETFLANRGVRRAPLR
jgi:hypothetical protein